MYDNEVVSRLLSYWGWGGGVEQKGDKLWGGGRVNTEQLISNTTNTNKTNVHTAHSHTTTQHTHLT